jgi:EAL domain-containing protein (putative c-di-GMP-specific phosphodiesterase class I)
MARAITARPLTSPTGSLERVLADGAYGIAYQPIFDVATGERFAVEALLRPLAGFPGPREMIDAAVTENRIGELGQRLRALAVRGCNDAPLFLNAHPHELDEPWLLRPDEPMFGHAHDVYLEITEGCPLRQRHVSRDVVRELSRRGVSVVVDDFGAGYSNLRYLADLEPKIVKLDREMLLDIEYSWRVIAMIRGLVRMAEDLGARVVAEGVETGVQLERVREAGVHYVQGFFLGRPSAVSIVPGPASEDFGPEKSGERPKLPE